jgi:hypothetical protein
MHDQVDEIGRTAVRSEPFDLAAIEGEGGWEPLQSVKTFVVSIRYNVIRPDTDSENLLLGMYQPSGRDLSKLSIVPYQHAHLSLRSTKGWALTIIPRENTSVLSSKSKPIKISGLI